MIIVINRNYKLLGVLVGLVVGLVIFFCKYNPIQVAELKAVDFSGCVELNEKESKALADELDKAPIQAKRVEIEPYCYLLIKKRQGTKKFLISRDNKVYDEKGQRVLPGQNFYSLFKTIRGRLDKQSPYGEMVTWEEADGFFPRYSKAVIQDIDSGLSFRVQRRAGSAHADVQPLTADDTKIMKEIYGGRWSWKRKAILVKVQGQKLAASMNGMPHGAGAIPGNKFPGHFCIHFFNCKTHSGNVNLAHQIMVWKAAGRFSEMTGKVDSKKALEIFFTAVDQGENQLAAHFIKPNSTENDILKHFEKVSWITLTEIDESEAIATEGKIIFSVKAKMGGNNGQQESLQGEIVLTKNSGSPGWNINAESLMDFFNI